MNASEKEMTWLPVVFCTGEAVSEHIIGVFRSRPEAETMRNLLERQATDGRKYFIHIAPVFGDPS